MARLTLRAVEQPDGRYRISMTPATPGVDIHRAYSGTELRQLAERMHAEVRWVSARDETSVRPEQAHEEEPPPDRRGIVGSVGWRLLGPGRGRPERRSLGRHAIRR